MWLSSFHLPLAINDFSLLKLQVLTFPHFSTGLFVFASTIHMQDLLTCIGHNSLICEAIVFLYSGCKLGLCCLLPKRLCACIWACMRVRVCNSNSNSSSCHRVIFSFISCAFCASPKKSFSTLRWWRPDPLLPSQGYKVLLFIFGP